MIRDGSRIEDKGCRYEALTMDLLIVTTNVCMRGDNFSKQASAQLGIS